jgi:hypothetical protein
MGASSGMSHLIEVFIPYYAMMCHMHTTLNERDENKIAVTIEWKDALLKELNFVGIVVRL